MDAARTSGTPDAPDGQEETLRQLRAQLAALPQARPFLRQSESELRAYVEGLRDQLAHGDYQAQRWVLHQGIARVVVGSELVIEYRTPT